MIVHDNPESKPSNLSAISFHVPQAEIEAEQLLKQILEGLLCKNWIYDDIWLGRLMKIIKVEGVHDDLLTLLAKWLVREEFLVD